MKEKAPCMHGVDFLRTFAWQILAASAVSALPALHSGSCGSAVRIPEACPAPDTCCFVCLLIFPWPLLSPPFVQVTDVRDLALAHAWASES